MKLRRKRWRVDVFLHLCGARSRSRGFTLPAEVKEEVGLSVKNIRYYKSQPWGFDSNLLLGYFCELDDEGDAMRLDEEELACAEWVDFEDVPDDSEGLSLTREMMLCFRDIMNASESTCLHD